MFAECYKVLFGFSTCCMASQGRAYVKQCPPGTQFCTIGNICDFPTKAKSPFSIQIPRLRATNYWCLMLPPMEQWQTSHNSRVEEVVAVEAEGDPAAMWFRLNTISPPSPSSCLKR